MTEIKLWVGVDWGSEAHQVVVLDAQGCLGWEGVVSHREAGVRELLDRLRTLVGGELAAVAVAIEMPRGAVVEALVEAGVEVYAINPKQLDRFRDRHSVAGAKDDRRDAWVLAVSLRTDLGCFRRVYPEDPLLIELREAGRIEAQIAAELQRLANRLWAQLHRVVPQLLELSPGADEPWLWDLLTENPHPQRLRTLSTSKATKLLRHHRIRRFGAEQLIVILRQPLLPVAPGTLDAVARHISLLVQQLQLLDRQRRECTSWLERLLAQLSSPPPEPGQPRRHRDAEILHSMPGVGKLVAAAVLGEAASAVAARDYQLLRALAGVAPVTRSSGKSRRVSMRHACSRRLRYAVHHWAFNSVQHDAASRARYQALRGRGHAHARALRSVADRNLRILTAMLRNGTLFGLPGQTTFRPPLPAP